VLVGAIQAFGGVVGLGGCLLVREIVREILCGLFWLVEM